MTKMLQHAGGLPGPHNGNAIDSNDDGQAYQGYQYGTATSEYEALEKQAAMVKKMPLPKAGLKAPKTWKTPSTFSMNEVASPWYSAMSKIQSSLFHASVGFFEKNDYRFIIVPQTTDSISSPMGLGSDSVPVHVKLHGDETYLADSMQFALERALRLDNETHGAYYVGTSFRGEDPDAMHLNQFCHIECELQGKLDDGIRIAEQYVVCIASYLLKHHEDLIMNIAGKTSHIVTLLENYSANKHAFPRITLDNALALPEIRDNEKAWAYVTPDDRRNGRILTRVGEHILMRLHGGIVWLTEMDHLSVPFYQAFVPNSGNSKAICADLLFGPGEVLGLGQRHVTIDEVSEALKMHKVEAGTSYGWYLEMRKAQEARLQTTGWGMGMERFLAWLLQHDDIRDVQIFSRLKGAMSCV